MMFNKKQDIKDLNDIQLMVDQFYSKVRADDLIGPIFISVIQDRWPEHLDKMYRFWQTALLNEPTYSGRPFPPHMDLPVEKRHFDRWIALFRETVDELFKGDKATDVKWRAEQMAIMFHSKIEYHRKNQSRPLI